MNRKGGISLITLIITIIVIIILAGAVILSLNNTNIIGNANRAVYDQDRESLIDTYTMITMDKFVTNSTKDEPIGNIDINELYTKIGKDLGDKFKVDNNDLLEKQEDGSYDIIAKFPNSGSYTRNKEYSVYNRPFIPDDFNYLEGTWDTGLVIKNKKDNNEFVWIPVKKSEDKTPEDKYYYYKKRDFLKSFIGKEDTINGTIPLAPQESNSNNIAQIEKENVEKYGGFYIGRYESAIKGNKRTEAGQVLQEDLIIQPSKPVCNYVTYIQARDLSNGLYKDKDDYISTLITGTQWDTVCMFLGKEDYADNSTGKGNYSGSLTYTAYNNYKVKNVYDMAGNAWEWTNEIYSLSFGVVRGGRYSNKSYECPAGYRSYVNSDASSFSGSFRVSLYIK